MGMTVAEEEAMTAANAAFAARTEADAVAPPEPMEPARAESPVADEVTAPPTSPMGLTNAPRASAARPPSRLLADLVRAMRSTAEESRTSLVDSMRKEGTTSIERIHARSAEEVEGLRRVADEDVSGIKEWSKAEIARIRAETEERISERKQELELSLEGHAALIEREVEHVQARITEYEAEMDAFFVRLEEIEDPSEFGAVAAEMPEPPSLEEASAAARAAALDELIRETTAARVEPERVEPERVEPEHVEAEHVDIQAPTTEPAVEAQVETSEPAQAFAQPVADAPVEPVAEAQVEAIAEAQVEPVVEAHAEPVVEAQADAVVEARTDSVVDAQAEAIVQAQPEPVEAQAWVVEAAAVAVEAPVDESTSSDLITDEGDPRLAALGLSADAPEGEATEADLGIDAMSEATIAARLGDASANGRSAPESSTSVVVIGLVSVASVAAFKRTLGKVAGVRSVGVSSGPEGEFVFKTAHDADVVLKDVIPTLPGFGARVVAAGEGVVNVSARDPESES
ncbi:MAG: hypothetical protein ABWY52_00215 [Candidatus Limnocylindrales bacterium]